MSNKKEIWSGIRRTLRSKLTDEEFNTWFSKATLEDFYFDLAIIGVPNKFIANWLEDKYLPDIKNAFRSNLNQSPDIRFTYADKADPLEFKKPLSETPRKVTFYSANLNPSMTFKRFVTGECSRFAYTSAVEVADRPADYYNPLYIYSAGGLGKTHLLHAIGNSIKDREPTRRVRYLSSDSFTSDFTYSIKNEKIQELRDKYRNLDILLFDDIHLLANRKRTQEEFLFVFNTLYNERKQIVISGDNPPNKLRDINTRLTSRLGWGLITEIKSPDNKTKVKIIKARSKEDNMTIPDDVLFYFANSVQDIKALVNNMVRFETYASLNDGDINICLAKTLIRDDQKTEIGIENIKMTVAGFFNLSLSDLVSNKKKRAYSYPRQLAMYLARKYTQLSYQHIGAAFGNKNHSTVIHAIKRIAEKKKDQKEIRDHLTQIENILS